jgi:hypothetical protein
MLQPYMLLGVMLLVAVALALWGAERFTDGALRTVVSDFAPNWLSGVNVNTSTPRAVFASL